MKRTRHELWSFYQQFDLSIKKTTCCGTCSKSQSKHLKPFHKQLAQKYIKYFNIKSEPYYKVSY